VDTGHDGWWRRRAEYAVDGISPDGSETPNWSLFHDTVAADTHLRSLGADPAKSDRRLVDPSPGCVAMGEGGCRRE
jgi:hypothetical protein